MCDIDVKHALATHLRAPVKRPARQILGLDYLRIALLLGHDLALYHVGLEARLLSPSPCLLMEVLERLLVALLGLLGWLGCPELRSLLDGENGRPLLLLIDLGL